MKNFITQTWIYCRSSADYYNYSLPRSSGGQLARQGHECYGYSTTLKVITNGYYSLLFLRLFNSYYVMLFLRLFNGYYLCYFVPRSSGGQLFIVMVIFNISDGYYSLLSPRSGGGQRPRHGHHRLCRRYGRRGDVQEREEVAARCEVQQH